MRLARELRVHPCPLAPAVPKKIKSRPTQLVEAEADPALHEPADLARGWQPAASKILQGC